MALLPFQKSKAECKVSIQTSLSAEIEAVGSKTLHKSPGREFLWVVIRQSLEIFIGDDNDGLFTADHNAPQPSRLGATYDFAKLRFGALKPPTHTTCWVFPENPIRHFIRLAGYLTGRLKLSE